MYVCYVCMAEAALQYDEAELQRRSRVVGIAAVKVYIHTYIMYCTFLNSTVYTHTYIFHTCILALLLIYHK